MMENTMNDNNNNYDKESFSNRKQDVFITSLFGIGLVICCYIFYAICIWMFAPNGLQDPSEANNFMLYAPMSMFGLISGCLVFGFGGVLCCFGFLSSIFELLE